MIKSKKLKIKNWLLENIAKQLTEYEIDSKFLLSVTGEKFKAEDVFIIKLEDGKPIKVRQKKLERIIEAKKGRTLNIIEFLEKKIKEL
jgi:hypothetical protein